MVDAVAAQVAPAGGAVVTALGVENVTSDDVSGVPAAADLDDEEARAAPRLAHGASSYGGRTTR